MSLNFELIEILHLASQALMSDDDTVKRIALGDIYHAVASAIRGTSAATEDEIHEAATEEPTETRSREEVEVEKQKQRATKHFSFCNGVFPIRRANTEAGVMEHVWIDGRRFTMDVVITDKEDGINKACEFTIRDNGQVKIAGRFYGGKSNAEKVAHMALKGYVKQLTGASKFHSRGGFLKQALKRHQEKEQE